MTLFVSGRSIACEEPEGRGRRHQGLPHQEPEGGDGVSHGGMLTRDSRL